MIEAIIRAVFKDGKRWSWKELKCPNGDVRTSFYHWPTEQEAREDCQRAYNENSHCMDCVERGVDPTAWAAQKTNCQTCGGSGAAQ